VPAPAMAVPMAAPSSLPTGRAAVFVMRAVVSHSVHLMVLLVI
jgi:hypothetical protein